MSQPLLATGRIILPYTHVGFTHHLHAYVRNPQLVGAVWQINSRATDANDTPWTNAATALALSFSYLLQLTDVFGTVLFQTLVSAVWITQATTTVANVNGSGTGQAAAEGTLMLRDKLFKKVKVVVMEPNVVPPLKANTYNPAGVDPGNLFIRQWTPDFTIAVAPWNWQVGRGNQFLAQAPFVSEVFTLNRKMRRARGFA